MKLPLTREDLLHNGKHPLVSDLYAQSRLAIDLAERLQAADDLIEEYDRLFGDAYKYGRIKTLTQIYESLTQEGKRKEEWK